MLWRNLFASGGVGFCLLSLRSDLGSKRMKTSNDKSINGDESHHAPWTRGGRFFQPVQAFISGVCHTLRQLLIMNSLVASRGDEPDKMKKTTAVKTRRRIDSGEENFEEGKTSGHKRHSSLGRDTEVMERDMGEGKHIWNLG
jgi:hypothetical protein